MGTADHGGASSWTARYVTVLSQARWLVLASWALLSVLAAWQGPLFLSECVMRMPPETWTRSARGRAVVSAAFPEREGKEILALLLASNDGSAVTTPAVAEFTRRLSAVALDFTPRWVVFDLEHYYSYNEELPSIAEAFVSHGAAHNRTHMLLLFTLMTHKTQVPLFVTCLDRAVERLRDQLLPARSYTTLMLGDAVFRRDGAAATARDTTIVDQARASQPNPPSPDPPL